MEVILLEKIEKLGNVGDIVKVRDGYGRNFLIPQQKALRATNDNKAYFEAQKAHIEKENEAKRKEAEKVASKIADNFFIIIRQAGEDGRLYGSVSSRDIAAAISEAGSEVARSQITLSNPIKYLGVYPLKIRLHAEVPVNVNVNVARSEDEAEQAKKEFLNPTVKKKEEAEEAAENPAETAEGEAAAESEEKPAKKAKKSSKKAEKQAEEE